MISAGLLAFAGKLLKVLEAGTWSLSGGVSQKLAWLLGGVGSRQELGPISLSASDLGALPPQPLGVVEGRGGVHACFGS